MPEIIAGNMVVLVKPLLAKQVGDNGVTVSYQRANGSAREINIPRELLRAVRDAKKPKRGKKAPPKNSQ